MSLVNQKCPDYTRRADEWGRGHYNLTPTLIDAMYRPRIPRPRGSIVLLPPF